MKLLYRVLITMGITEMGLLASMMKDSCIPSALAGLFVYILWKPLFDKEREVANVKE